MALYKLSFAIFPIKDIYARSKLDIADWLDWYRQNPIEVYARTGTPGTMVDIVQVERGELRFDFGGIVSGNEYACINFLPDFTAKIRLESLPHFPAFRARLPEQKVGNLYQVQNFDGGLNPLSYVPADVFKALKKCDVSAHEERAEKHIGRLNRALSDSKYFQVLPRVTKKGKFN